MGAETTGGVSFSNRLLLCAIKAEYSPDVCYDVVMFDVVPSTTQAGLLDKMRARAASRQLSDLTIGPVLTWTTDAILGHMNKLLAVPGESSQEREGFCLGATNVGS